MIELKSQDRLRLLPRPAADKRLFTTNLNQGFKSFPKRKNNYLKYKLSEKNKVLDYLPIRMDIENVSRCNFHCTMCQVSDWPKYRRAEDMSFKDYKTLIDSQFGLIEIKLQGMGEPLLGKTYFDMIAYARERYIWVRSTTNASLLHINENYKRLIDSDICEIQISVDGATRESYETIRRGGKFDRVLKNCGLINRYGDSIKQKRTRMWVVVQKQNLKEMEKLTVLASELGFDRLTFSLDLNDWGQDKWKIVNDQVDMHREFSLESAQNLVSLGKKLKVEVTFWFIDEKYQIGDRNNICPWPFERLYISSDMRIVPCCMMSTPEVYDLGSARNLTTEWNSESMISFRRMHLNGNIPHVCWSCYNV